MGQDSGRPQGNTGAEQHQPGFLRCQERLVGRRTTSPSSTASSSLGLTLNDDEHIEIVTTAMFESPENRHAWRSASSTHARRLPDIERHEPEADGRGAPAHRPGSQAQEVVRRRQTARTARRRHMQGPEPKNDAVRSRSAAVLVATKILSSRTVPEQSPGQHQRRVPQDATDQRCN